MGTPSEASFDGKQRAQLEHVAVFHHLLRRVPFGQEECGLWAGGRRHGSVEGYGKGWQKKRRAKGRCCYSKLRRSQNEGDVNFDSQSFKMSLQRCDRPFD